MEFWELMAGQKFVLTSVGVFEVGPSLLYLLIIRLQTFHS
jgi:hypothetical protein